MNEIYKLIDEADGVIIGAGAGLSTAAGINYAGEEFRKEFRNLSLNSASQIYIHHHFMILIQRKNIGHIGQNTLILLTQEEKVQNYIKRFMK